MFTEDLAPFFADFAVAGTLNGVPVFGMLDAEAQDDGNGLVMHGHSYLLDPAAAVVAQPGQQLVVAGVTYAVRQVVSEPPDGTLKRLVLARQG